MDRRTPGGEGGQALDERAVALSIFREGSGEGVRYTAVTFPANPWGGCERSLRMFRAVGWVGDNHVGAYGVLDVLDENGDIVQDFPITTNVAFQRIKKQLNLEVERP